MIYKDKIYGIWIWTDERMVWYWKDLFKKAGIDADSVKTWNGFCAAAKKINDALKDKGMQGVHNSSVEGAEWYPYLLDARRKYFRFKDGHPTKRYIGFLSLTGQKASRR